MSDVSGDFPVQLATRLSDWPAGGLLPCGAARLSACRVVYKLHEPDTHDLLRTSREYPRSILVRHARFLVTC